MKQETQPTFYFVEQETKRKKVILETFIIYLQEAQSLEFVKTHQKNIEQHLSILSKTADNEQHLYQIITFICSLFRANPHSAYLSMIRTLIHIDSKFEAKNGQTSMQQENIRMINNNEVIALTNFQAPPPVIVLYGPEPMSDVTEQKIHSTSQNYFNDDNQIVSEYLKSPFIVVKREGISQYFTKAVQILCKELYKQYMETQFILLPMSIIVDLLKLLEEIKDSIYSFYFLNISQTIINQLSVLFEKTQTQKKLSKDDAQSIIYLSKKLVEPFSEFKLEIEEETEWNLSKRIISLFINSHVSQKKLYAVKLLSQRCRRSTFYQSKISREILQKFIKDANILSQIYRADNHPEVITKGEQIFLYLINEENLDESYINIIFNLLEKCNQHLSKSLFSTLQKTGHKNIEKNRKYLLKKIYDLPRPSCFNEETFMLINVILISTPSEEFQNSLEVLYGIMQKNYDKLKQNLKNKAVASYFEVFIMGIQSDVFSDENAMLTLKPILHNPNSSLFSFMIENFIFRIKDQYTKKIGAKCKKTLNTAIKKLISEEKIHKLQVKDQQKHYQILNLLLENLENFDQHLLSSDDLWTLIKSNRKFAKFLKFYPEQTQISLISHLIFSTQKTLYDIECIIQLFQLISQNVKDGVAPLLIEEFFHSTILMTKYLLAPFIIQIKPLEIQEVLEILRKQQNIYIALSWIIYIKQIIKRADEKGFGLYPPFEYVRDSYQITVKVTNNINQFSPIESQIKINNYNNLYELIKVAANSENFNISKLRAKINDSHVTFNQLKEKILNITTHKYITLDIYETLQCEWFNKQALFEEDGSLKDQITSILRQVYYTYANEKGVLQAVELANIFQKATNTEVIHEKDGRILGIINTHSSNGIHLKIDEWLAFFYQSSLQNPIIVISNLRNLGYSGVLKGQQKFQEVFSSENKLRTFLLKDGRVYDLLFKTFDKLIVKCSENEEKDIMNQFTSILKLLPPSQHVINSIKEGQGQIFSYQSSNNLYFWYCSSIAQSIFFRKLYIQQYQQWRTAFLGSDDINQFIILYEKYLSKVLLKGPKNLHLNSDIEIQMLQNLGKIIRQKFSYIPSLIDIGGQLIPIEKIEYSFKHIDEKLSQHIKQLGQFCQVICKAKRNNEIAQHAVSIIIDIARHSHPNTMIVVLKQLVFHQIQTVRQMFNKFYYLLSKLFPSIKKEFYSFRVAKNSSSSYKNCTEYFFILNRMLLEEEDETYCQQISLIYQKDISQQKNIENMAEEAETDQILLGKLKILSEIKRYNPETEITSTTISSIKQLLENSNAQDVREILYSMSNNICDVQYSLQLIYKIMLKTKLKRNSLKRGNKKMGIMNLGCICYINSVLQQLQMIVPFRRGIIRAEADYQNIDFFKQFQYIIYQLTFGQRIFVIPQNFCLNYLDHNNMPINIKQQHDADEFLNQLLDRLQFRLKNTNQHDLINNNFKGQLVNVISCDKCYNKKQKIQNFYILTVQIKNQSSLRECLNKLIEPQIICDYYCDFCEQKVQSIQKYNKFEALPPFLFIHLQRLVFDLQTLMKIKLDHPVSFPTQIDLQQYYHHEVGNQIYLLKGFIVHQGSSQGGHYYSIIKCENGWIKFDDTRIDDWDWNSSSNDRDHAYLLIYEKQQRAKQIVSQQIQIGNPQIMKLVKEDIDHLMKEKIFLQPSFLRYLITTLDKISLPQQFSLGSVQLNDPYHFNFNNLPQQLCKNLDQALQVIIKFIQLYSEMLQMRASPTYDVARDNNDGAVFKQNQQIHKIVVFAIFILHLRPKLAFSLAEKYLNSDHFFKNIYNHKDKIIRQSLKLILLKVFLILSSQTTDSFLIPIPQNEIISKLLQKIIGALQEVGKSNSSKMVQFFSMLQLLCRLDNRFTQWFQANKLGPRLIHFYMQKQSNLHGLLPEYPFYMSTDRKIEAIIYVIQTIFSIIPYEPDLSLQGQQYQLEHKAYLNIDLYMKLMDERYENQRITTLFNYAAKNAKMNQKIMNLIIQNLNRSNHQDRFIYSYIHILYGLLTIKDSLSRSRYQKLLGVPVLSTNSQNFKERYCANTDNDRICRYLNPYLWPADEIIYPFLELLYSNRHQHSYFTFLGIIGLLKLMINVPQVLIYINELPGPSKQCPLYVKWINDFIFNFQRNHREEGFSRLPHQQKQQFLQQIVANMRLLQIAQQKSYETQLKIPLQGKLNQYFKIGSIDHQSGWQSASLQYFENLYLFNCENLQQISNNILPQEIVDLRYNILYIDNEGAEQGKALQLRVSTKLKMKISFSQFYNYQLILVAGEHSISLPYQQNMLSSIKVELLEQVRQRIVQKKEQANQMVMMEQYLKSESGYLQAQKIDQFPTIKQVYEQPCSDAANQMNIEEKESLNIQCPFCSHIAHQLVNRCPNCNQQWGW